MTLNDCRRVTSPTRLLPWATDRQQVEEGNKAKRETEHGAVVKHQHQQICTDTLSCSQMRGGSHGDT